MEATLLQLGRIAGVLGILLVVGSVGARLAGMYHVGPFQSGTLMLAGVAGLATGCFLLLWGISARAR